MLTTVGGVARTRLFSGGDKECEVQIMALVAGKRAERSEVVFIQSSPSEDAQGSRVLTVDADDYLAFFDDAQLIEGLKNVRLKFRRIQITGADRLQVRVGSPYCLNAKNAVLSNGKETIKTRWLYMEFRRDNVYGVALVEDPNPHTFEFVNEDFESGQWFYPENKWREWDTEGGKVVVKADDIMVIPDVKIILSRARIYYDNVQLPLPMSAHVIPLSGAGTSGSAIPQVLGFTYPGGLFVDYPWYFATTERYTGALRVRHGSQSGSYTTRRGWYADLDVEYLKQGSMGGHLVVDGIGQGDWGARWSHNATYSPSTRGSYSVAWPQHRYLSAYGNVTTTGSRATRMINGSWFSGAGMPQDWYVDTSWRFKAKRLGGFGLGYGFTMGLKQDGWADELYGRAAISTSLQARRPWKVIGNFTLAPRASGGLEQRTNGSTEWNTLVGLEGVLRFSRLGSIRLAYDTQTRNGGSLQNGTRHYLRGGVSYYGGGSHPFSVTMSGSRDLDNMRTTAYGWANWEFTPQWSLRLTGLMNRSTTYSYEDFTYGIGRRIGQAEASVAYSTQRKRWEFEFSRAGLF
jgi:hypothetical protein